MGAGASVGVGSTWRATGWSTRMAGATGRGGLAVESATGIICMPVAVEIGDFEAAVAGYIAAVAHAVAVAVAHAVAVAVGSRVAVAACIANRVAVAIGDVTRVAVAAGFDLIPEEAAPVAVAGTRVTVGLIILSRLARLLSGPLAPMAG